MIQSVGAQTTKELTALLERDLLAYQQASLAGNFEKSFEYMPPKMFDIVPRDSLIQLMRQSMDNEYMTIQLTGMAFKPKKKIKVKKAGAYHWTLIPYEGSMRMVFKDEVEYKAMVVMMMKDKFGQGNVQEEGDSVMNILLKNKTLIAFKDPALSRWSLLEDKRKAKGGTSDMEKTIYETVVPEEVRKAMGN